MSERGAPCGEWHHDHCPGNHVKPESLPAAVRAVAEALDEHVGGGDGYDDVEVFLADERVQAYLQAHSAEREQKMVALIEGMATAVRQMAEVTKSYADEAREHRWQQRPQVEHSQEVLEELAHELARGVGEFEVRPEWTSTLSANADDPADMIVVQVLAEAHDGERAAQVESMLQALRSERVQELLGRITSQS